MSAPILWYFNADHLSPLLRSVARPFGQLAQQIDELIADGQQKTVALQKLLEAKDAAVRAALKSCLDWETEVELPISRIDRPTLECPSLMADPSILRTIPT